SIIKKDIIGRYPIKFPVALEELASILINSFSCKISVNRIAKILNIKSPHTVKEYISYLESTFLLFGISKFSYKLKEHYTCFKKMYVIDNGIVSSMVFDFSSNKGRLLENCVAVELYRRSIMENYEFFYWDDQRRECDFIIKKGPKITAVYQVCYELTENNRQREYAGLIKALKEFNIKRGYILTMGQRDANIVEGFCVTVLPVWQWMLFRQNNRKH
ncbi:MAG: DUF4143 domain-containing protein, partial [bacterium]